MSQEKINGNSYEIKKLYQNKEFTKIIRMKENILNVKDFNIRMFLAKSYFKKKEYKKCVEVLMSLLNSDTKLNNKNKKEVFNYFKMCSVSFKLQLYIYKKGNTFEYNLPFFKKVELSLINFIIKKISIILKISAFISIFWFVLENYIWQFFPNFFILNNFYINWIIFYFLSSVFFLWVVWSLFLNNKARIWLISFIIKNLVKK